MLRTILLWFLLIILSIPYIHQAYSWNNCMLIYVKQLVNKEVEWWYLYVNPNHIDSIYMEEFELSWYSKWCNMYSDSIISDIINTHYCYSIYFMIKYIWDYDFGKEV